jgi:hypothetical protein
MNLPIHRSEKNEQQRNAENLERHLDYLSSQVAAETTDAEMEDALQEALTKARPERNWHSSIRVHRR